MPMQRALYPEDWEAMLQRSRFTNAHMVKEEANWTCEHCSRLCLRPGEDLIDFCKRLNSLPFSDIVKHPKRWELGVAHLNHNPANCDRTNLKALCTPCHCRYDLSQMPRKRQSSHSSFPIPPDPPDRMLQLVNP